MGVNWPCLFLVRMKTLTHAYFVRMPSSQKTARFRRISRTSCREFAACKIYHSFSYVRLTHRFYSGKGISKMRMTVFFPSFQPPITLLLPSNRDSLKHHPSLIDTITTQYSTSSSKKTDRPTPSTTVQFISTMIVSRTVFLFLATLATVSAFSPASPSTTSVSDAWQKRRSRPKGVSQMGSMETWFRGAILQDRR